MKAPALLFALLVASTAVAQDRRSELSKAYEEARAAYIALQAAEARRDEAREPLPGERLGTASGATRPTEQYFGRQQLLEHEVELARRRYDAAVRHWNALK